jgi:hypothetical protein
MRPLTHRRPIALTEFVYGSAYYPEHWDEAGRVSLPSMDVLAVVSASK